MRKITTFLVAVMAASCGLIDEGTEKMPGETPGSGGETASDGGTSNTGGEETTASGGKGEKPTDAVSREECVAAAVDSIFEPTEAEVVCDACLGRMNEECSDDPSRCFLRICDSGPICTCTETRFCAEDALREAGMGRLMCEYRSTDDVSCPLSQQFCSGEGENEPCFCDFFRPASKEDCPQYVNFSCTDGLRDCYCLGLPEDVAEYDCRFHAQWWEEIEGVPQECTLTCPDGDFTAQECDCICSAL